MSACASREFQRHSEPRFHDEHVKQAPHPVFEAKQSDAICCKAQSEFDGKKTREAVLHDLDVQRPKIHGSDAQLDVNPDEYRIQQDHCRKKTVE